MEPFEFFPIRWKRKNDLAKYAWDMFVMFGLYIFIYVDHLSRMLQIGENIRYNRTYIIYNRIGRMLNVRMLDCVGLSCII